MNYKSGQWFKRTPYKMGEHLITFLNFLSTTLFLKMGHRGFPNTLTKLSKMAFGP